MTGSGDDGDDVWDPFGDDGDDGSTRGTDDPAEDDASPDSTDSDDRGTGPSGEDETGSPGKEETGSPWEDETGSPDDASTGTHGDDADDREGGEADDREGGDDDRAEWNRSGGDGPPSASPDPPSPESPGDDGADDPISWFLNTENAVVVTVREVLSTVGLVLLIGFLLFAISGIYPPLVAVESGSMEPHMFKGDLVFIVENGRYAPDGAHAGVVTYQQGNDSDGRVTGYWSFGDHGNVVVYRPNGRGGTPIIHRARFYVEEGENWYDEADPRYVGSADDCEELRACPAPHDGFITKGDNNRLYDQVAGRSTVVRAEWIRGVAKVRVPWLGCIRLELSGDSCF